MIAIPQLNFHYTHGVNESYHSLQHHCLPLAAYYKTFWNVYEVISFCMGEIPVNYSTKINIFFSNFIFAELSKQNITSEDLYRWSASIDLIEDYQLYLNQQLTTSTDLSLAETVFYNCTLPRFGPLCQYEFESFHPTYSSLAEIIYDFYGNYHHYNAMTTLTCYIHLQCNRGPPPACLQWTDICNGRIDCLDGGFDEEHCWQLEINECEDDEYRCSNGQCILNLFKQEMSGTPDCIDASDTKSVSYFCLLTQDPFFQCEDISSVSLDVRGFDQIISRILLMNAMYSNRTSVLTQECFSALKSLANLTFSTSVLYENNQYITIIQSTCPDMFFF